MTSTSLHGRVRRLEIAQGEADDRAAQMREARQRRLSLTPEQAAAWHQQRVAQAVAELSAPDRPRDPVQAMQRRFARRHQEAAA